MTLKKSKTWPEVFLKSIKVGIDLESAKVKFICVVLEHNLVSMKKTKFDKKEFSDVQKAIKGSCKAVSEMITAQKSGDSKLIIAAWSAAARSAESAARSAAARSAESAAWSAESAESAAWSAARSAESAARSAESAARSAARSARSARSAESAESAAYDYYADELIKILKSI
jgi:hypothetical protein